MAISLFPIKTILLIGICFFSLLSNAAGLRLHTKSQLGQDTETEPIGGNTGRNLASQRQKVFEHASELWKKYLLFTVDTWVELRFSPLSCDINRAVLANAGPTGFQNDFNNAPLNNVFYVNALASNLKQVELSSPSIEITINSSISNNPQCLNGASWYLGLDGKAPQGQVDLLGILMHEIAHGLGFLSLTNFETGSLIRNRIDSFSLWLFDTKVNKYWYDLSDNQRKNVIQGSSELVFRSSQVLSFTNFMQDGYNSEGILMHTPKPAVRGSSLSHFNSSVLFYDAIFANELLEPNYKSNFVSYLTTAVLGNIGWQLIRDSDQDGLTDDIDCLPLQVNDSCEGVDTSALEPNFNSIEQRRAPPDEGGSLNIIFLTLLLILFVIRNQFVSMKFQQFIIKI